jgi:hypothetical protein
MTQDDDPTGPAADLIDRVRQYWTGRAVVLLVNRFDGATRALADELVACGATIGAVVTGRPRTDESVALPVQPPTWVAADHGITVRRKDFDSWLRTPPAALEHWLDQLDPGREWLVIGTSYTDVEQFCDREVHGWWRPEWQVWEDKTRVDELWEHTGMPAPPYTVLPLDSPHLADEVTRLDHGSGVVLAIDATHSALGSSKGLRWIRRADELLSAVEAFTGRTEQVRVATFVAGVPFSILAMVLPTGVAVFEPFEIVTLRDPVTADLVYGGTSTWWRPDPAVREAIRRHTRLVGAELANRCGYRGLFSVDGVADEQQFAATELNPRHVSGLSLWAGWPQFPVRLFNRAIQQQVPEIAEAADPHLVEDRFGAAIRARPAYVVKVPGPQQALGEGELVLPTTAGPAPAIQKISYVAVPDGLRIVDLDPVLPDGTAAPAAAALGNAINGTALVPSRDELVPSMDDLSLSHDEPGPSPDEPRLSRDERGRLSTPTVGTPDRRVG